MPCGQGHVSAADVDFADLGRRETLLDQDRPECIERGVNAGEVGIHLEADLAGFQLWPSPSINRAGFGVRENELRNPP